MVKVDRTSMMQLYVCERPRLSHARRTLWLEHAQRFAGTAGREHAGNLSCDVGKPRASRNFPSAV